MSRTRPTELERLYALAKQSAEDAAGAKGFAIIGSRLRRALVAEAILQLADQQDEAVSDAKVRSLVRDLRGMWRDDESLYTE